jgi:hypothetical protein
LRRAAASSTPVAAAISAWVLLCTPPTRPPLMSRRALLELILAERQRWPAVLLHDEDTVVQHWPLTLCISSSISDLCNNRVSKLWLCDAFALRGWLWNFIYFIWVVACSSFAFVVVAWDSVNIVISSFQLKAASLCDLFLSWCWHTGYWLSWCWHTGSITRHFRYRVHSGGKSILRIIDGTNCLWSVSLLMKYKLVFLVVWR